MNPRTLALALLLAASAALAGCWEDTEVTLHEPGEYKGQPDPLRQEQALARAETLEKRFQRVQTDR